MYLIMIRKLEQ